MKLFNVHLEVQISFAGELSEPLLPSSANEESFVELVENERPGSDPMKLQAKLLDKLYNKIPGPSSATSIAMLPGMSFGNEGVSMSQNVRIVASSFEELQKILARFHDVAESLQVPG